MIKAKTVLHGRIVASIIAAIFLSACSGIGDLNLDNSSETFGNNKSNVYEPADPSSPDYLTGVDGATTVNVAGTVLNNYSDLRADVLAGDTQIRMQTAGDLDSATFGALGAGDLVLVIQMQGATIDATDTSAYGSVSALNSAGRYEFVSVSSVAGRRINLNCGLQYDYTVAGHTQLIRVPQLTSLTVTSPGTITAPAWNGTSGGIVALHVQGNAAINVTGGISVNGLGFRGGVLENSSGAAGAPPLTIYRSTANTDGGEKGEGIAGFQTEYDALNGRYGRGAPANGGGGGNSHNAGGAGGSNGDNGNTWTGQGYMDSTVTGGTSAWPLDPGYITAGTYTTSSGGGRGGYTYSSANQNALTVAPGTASWGGDLRDETGGLGGRPLTNDPANGRIYMGGGGGAGDANNGPVGGAGGAGGGIVFLVANSVSGTGDRKSVV